MRDTHTCEQRTYVASRCRNEKYTVRRYLPGDEVEILQLFQLASSKHTLDYWRWKYQDTPLKKNFIVVAESDNKIVGCDHNTFITIKIGNKILPCTYGSGLIVHPDFRRRGINTNMRKLLWALREKNCVPFHYSITYNPIMVKHLSKLKNPFPHPVNTLFWIRDVRLHFRLNSHTRATEWFMRLGINAFKLINEIQNIFRHEYKNPNLRISKISNFNENIDMFCMEVSRHHNFLVERSRKYLNWRYCDPRAGEYIIKQAEEDDKVVGYSVIMIDKDREEYPFGHFIDLLALPGRLDVADALVEDVMNYFKSNRVNVCTNIVVKDHPYESIFKKHGFLNRRKKNHIFYLTQGIEDDIKKLITSSPSKIHLCQGDFN